ncbi:MAG: LLM class F420-dependent oxidoreductase [Chloroflexi bacterium]|nr:LLM class F420-dependent oxidoreductase [Chloroflexota bacterium]
MRSGVILPNIGAGVGPEELVHAAQRAEELGYANLWVPERLLYPLAPRSPYPVTPDGSLPPYYKHALTPVETLTYVASQTRRIGLGMSVLLMPLHNPVLLARQIATLDVLSGGRVRLGLGQGWSRDELEAGGGTAGQRGARADEYVAVLKAIWTTDPAEFQGQYFTLPRSILQPKPLQRPHPPIYMAAYVPSALRRVARHTDGWMPSGVSLAAVGPLMEQVRQEARTVGRDPDALELLVWAFVAVQDRPAGEGRPDFVGTWDEIRRDVETARQLGASEIVFMPGYGTGELSLETYFRLLEPLRQLV